MAHIAMGRFVFYAQATIIANIFQFGTGTGTIGGSQQYSHSSQKNNHHHDGSVSIEETVKQAAATAALINDQQEEQEEQQTDTGSSPKNDDLIVDLPGLDYDPGFDQYAGYLTLNDDENDGNDLRHMFYWYVESQNDPENDPVILWTNGGPGCSGFLGLGTEHGPFFIDSNGQLTENPFSWNKVANMLYVEQPIGVGYSYSDSEMDDDDDYYTSDDTSAASDNYMSIRKFLRRFPHRRTNDFYISSESYGGHYMPQLTKEILQRNVDGFINFKGMMVGNPYVDPFTNSLTLFQTWYNHGILSYPVYNKFVVHCSDVHDFNSQECVDLQRQMFQEMGNGINPYALDYPICLEDGRYGFAGGSTIQNSYIKSTNGDSSSSSIVVGVTRTPSNSRRVLSSQSYQLLNRTTTTTTTTTTFATDDDEDGTGPPFLPLQDHYHPCADEHLTTYLNRQDVVDAIHANPSTLPWSGCSTRLSYSDNDIATSLIGLYRELVKMIIYDTSLNILVFSGDDDSICSLPGTQLWIWDLGIEPNKDKYWEPWYVMNQTAGYVTRFDLGTYHTSKKKAKTTTTKTKTKQQHHNHNDDDEDTSTSTTTTPTTSSSSSSFTFVTVHGAGHEVPAYRPMEALELLKNYLNDKW